MTDVLRKRFIKIFHDAVVDRSLPYFVTSYFSFHQLFDICSVLLLEGFYIDFIPVQKCC